MVSGIQGFRHKVFLGPMRFWLASCSFSSTIFFPSLSIKYKGFLSFISPSTSPLLKQPEKQEEEGAEFHFAVSFLASLLFIPLLFIRLSVFFKCWNPTHDEPTIPLSWSEGRSCQLVFNINVTINLGNSQKCIKLLAHFFLKKKVNEDLSISKKYKRFPKFFKSNDKNALKFQMFPLISH